MRGLLAALRFLTIIPVPPFEDDRIGFPAAIVYFPLVGIILGVLISGTNLLAGAILPRFLAATATIAVWIGLTGALHLDGFVDSADGLLSARSPEARRRIMKDVAVGSFGAVALVLLVLAKFSAIVDMYAGSPPTAGFVVTLICAPAVGRASMIYAMIRFPAAKDSGLGSRAKESVRPLHLQVAGATCALLPLLLLTVSANAWLMYVAVAASLLIAEIFGRFVVRRVGGFSGDTYGAMCEIVELVVLATSAAFIGSRV
ncbi:MAG TPA: adenosylcobinamide-GDP ribazoletransferase [Spirochaetia bacterium]|nr:adenosylcobinamide-GDP ribazoletransferase [Spirochaetia bacterium]